MEEKTKLNMQMYDAESILAPLQKLNLMDDFLFDAATGDLETCRIIIELSLGIRIRNIAWKEGQKVIRNLPGNRGIRMDFYVEDDRGRVFDVEMQKRNEGNIPKRTRFYQALIDAPMLKSGERGFDSLKPAYIVVICGFDLYGYGLYRYTFDNRCKEIQDLVMGDECSKIILNTKGESEAGVDRALIDFLHYVEKIGMDRIAAQEQDLLEYATAQLKQIEGMRIFGEAADKGAVISFLVGNIHHYDMGMLLDRLGIAVRTGHHCAQPLMQALGIEGTVRASFSFYNTREEVDVLVRGIERVRQMFG